MNNTRIAIQNRKPFQAEKTEGSSGVWSSGSVIHLAMSCLFGAVVLGIYFIYRWCSGFGAGGSILITGFISLCGAAILGKIVRNLTH